jgi:hypothetical protein
MQYMHEAQACHLHNNSPNLHIVASAPSVKCMLKKMKYIDESTINDTGTANNLYPVQKRQLIASRHSCQTPGEPI